MTQAGPGHGASIDPEVSVEKYRFMSPAWIAMAREQITGALAHEDLRGVDFTLCEEFTSPPDDLRREGQTTIGFFVRVANGRVEVGDHPIDDADFKVVSRYGDALAVARDPDAPAAEQSVMEERIAEGRLSVVGDPSAVPAPIAALDIHRLLATRTL
jgi:hypothetical protein